MRRILACALIALAGCAGCSGAAASPTRVPAALTVRSGPPASVTSVAGFRWSALASSPLGGRSGPLVAWAGGELLEFGGLVESGSRATSAGAAFDQATGRWRRIAAVPAAAGVNLKDPTGLSENPAGVWTGKYLAVANGLVKPCPKTGPATAESATSTAAATACWTGAALYDPTANRWTALTLPKQLDGLEVSAVAWTGRDIVVAAVDTAAFDTNQGRLAVAAYAPATGRWRVITPAAARWTGLPAVPDHPSLSVNPVWTGTELLSLTDSGRLFALHR